MLTLLLIATILVTGSTAAIGKPRTPLTTVASKPSQAPVDKCIANPTVWQIPLGHSEVTISYLNNKGRVIFERDFSVSGGNKIKLHSRGNNGKSED